MISKVSFLHCSCHVGGLDAARLDSGDLSDDLFSDACSIMSSATTGLSPAAALFLACFPYHSFLILILVTRRMRCRQQLRAAPHAAAVGFPREP